MSVENKFTNRLSKETSPYLLQHAHNPVDWYPWGEEAFSKAKQENKPIFLSVGYSACHWCHVMEHESFEDEETAKMMNELYINIKVDREERPDVDTIYMSVVQLLTGQGGWPMSVFLTPDQKPFFGGTYFPKERRYGMPSFKELLSSVHRYYGKIRKNWTKILVRLCITCKFLIIISGVKPRLLQKRLLPIPSKVSLITMILLMADLAINQNSLILLIWICSCGNIKKVEKKFTWKWSKQR